MKNVAAIGAVSALASIASAISTVSVQGNAFFANGQRFYIRGVDYQPGGSSNAQDPIANAANCMRDIAVFKQLGINTIRVYSVDNTKDHDTCMNALSAAGIYLAVDVNNSLYSINRDQPAESYNAPYLQSVFATIDAFAKYDNTLLFYSGNEVINSDTNTDCAPYIKAVTRDMKNYIQARNYRHIPVGYSAADVAENRYQTAVYMNCGPDGMARSDFFAFNDYSWCDPSSFTMSGWNQKVEQYGNYSIPLFLSEFGCITNPPRDFGEIQALYSNMMTPVYSGGLVYEYTEEADNAGYGLVNADGSTATPIQPGFNNLKNMLAANVPSGSGGYKANGQYFQDCPAFSSSWNVKVGNGLPSIPSAAVQYMKNGAGTGPGLSGPGSQTAGDGSAAIVTQTAADSGYTAGSTGSPNSSGSSGSSGSSTGKSAAVALQPLEWQMGPLLSIAAVLASSAFGIALL